MNKGRSTEPPPVLSPILPFVFQGVIYVFQASRDTDEQVSGLRQGQQANSQSVCGVWSGATAAVKYHLSDLRIYESAYCQRVRSMWCHRGRDHSGYGQGPQRPKSAGDACGAEGTRCVRRRAASACRARNAAASAVGAIRCRQHRWRTKTTQRSTGAVRPTKKLSLVKGEHHGYARSSKDVGLPGMRQAQQTDS